MSAVVELGGEALISLWDLGRAIARVKRPVVAEGAIGIDCVVMKYWDTGIPHYPAESTGSFAVDVNTSVSSKKTLWSSSELSDEERHRLTELLPKLPKLRYPVDESQREQFLTAYRELVHGRWNWEPLFLTEVDVARQQAEQQKIQFDQINALRDAFERGKLVVCDSRHVPIKRITFSSECFVSKWTAIEYLEAIGVAYRKRPRSTYLDPECNKGSDEAIVTQVEPRLLSGAEGWQPGQQKLNPEMVLELLKFHNEQKEANAKRGRGKRIPFVKLTAERFGISRRHVSNIVKAAEEVAQEESRIDHLLAEKREELRPCAEPVPT